MKIICKPRGHGKTTELIEHAKTLEGYNLIVVHDRAECFRLWKIIQEKGYKLPMPISFSEFTEQKFCGVNVNAFLIDNADLLIQYLARGVNVEAVTFTKKELKNNENHN